MLPIKLSSRRLFLTLARPHHGHPGRVWGVAGDAHLGGGGGSAGAVLEQAGVGLTALQARESWDGKRDLVERGQETERQRDREGEREREREM